jgi:ESF2/ABP1 family protein
MSTTRLNAFLDPNESDNDHHSTYDSEEEFTKSQLTAKRRRIDADSGNSGAEDSLEDDDESGSEDGGDNEAENDAPNRVSVDAGDDTQPPPARITDQKHDTATSEIPLLPEEADSATDQPAPKLKVARQKLKLHVDKPLLHKNMITTDEAIKKSGVIYLSRIPPFLKPSKLRSLLAPYGSINRIFLSPEDPASHARRVRAGGNKKRSFTEGWVEFVRKKDAKQAAELLNTRPIGGRKGSYYHDDIWSMLYLRGFKWRDLTGQIAAEDAERSSRLRAELARAAKSDREFVRNIEQSKQVTGIKRKRSERSSGTSVAKAAPPPSNGVVDFEGTRMSFRQVPLARKRAATGGEDAPADIVRALGKIF